MYPIFLAIDANFERLQPTIYAVSVKRMAALSYGYHARVLAAFASELAVGDAFAQIDEHLIADITVAFGVKYSFFLTVLWLTCSRFLVRAALWFVCYILRFLLV